MAKATSKTDEMKTYVMTTTGGGMRRVTVPAKWKVTFGPLVPPKERDHGSSKGFALRFYEGANQQRAVFTDVIAFRDESLKVEERITKTKHKVATKQAPGGAKQVVMEARVTEWRDPLQPDDGGDTEFLSLTDET